MKRKILVLDQAASENSGRLLQDIADQLAIELRNAQLGQDPVPDHREFNALILAGGGVNGHQQEPSPVMAKERQFLQTWLELDKPCLGFCSGHQMLAEAFQARIGSNFMSSIGFINGHLTHDGRNHPLFRGMEPTIPLFKKNNIAIQTPVPENFLLLATSSECMVEAFTIKGRPHIVGMQCNNHVAHPDDVRLWMKKDPDWLDRLPPGRISSQALMNQAEKSLAAQREIMMKIIGNLLTFID